MKAIALLFLFMVTAASCLAEDGTVTGSGRLVTQERTLPSFATVELEGAFSAEITCSQAAGLTISGDDNIVPLVEAAVGNGRLRIHAKRPYSTRSPLHLVIGTPVLRALKVSGANTLRVARLRGAEVSVDLEGSSLVTLAGQAQRLRAVLSGGSTLHADGLAAEQVAVDISGAGVAEVHAERKLMVKVTGVGDVRYSGQPEVTRQILGVGTVSPR